MGHPVQADWGHAPRLDEASRRRYLQANCYYHPERLASFVCGRCGRGLCHDSARRSEEGVRCDDCISAPDLPVYVCGRCGWLWVNANGFDREREAPAEPQSREGEAPAEPVWVEPGLARASPSRGTVDAEAPPRDCRRCGAGAPLLLRYGKRLDGSGLKFWDRRFRGSTRDDRLWVFGLAWLCTYGVGLLAGSPLTMVGIPQSAAWWVFLGAISCACGLTAASIARRSSRYELVLSHDGIEIWKRHRVAEALSWNEVLGLEFVPQARPSHLIIHGPGRQIVVDRGLPGWEEAVALIRQHALVAPPPTPPL